MNFPKIDMNQTNFQIRLLNVLTAINKNLSAIRKSIAPTDSAESDADVIETESESPCASINAKETVAAMRRLIASQTNIPTEFARVIEDKFWDLL